MDFILISATSQIRDGLDLMLESAIGSHDYIHSYVDVSIALLILEIAKKSEDKDEWYPLGKWATIQVIQDRIEAAINAAFAQNGE